MEVEKIMLKKGLFVLTVALILSSFLFAQTEYMSGIPRNEIIIIENPDGRATDPDNFNIWAPGSPSWSRGLQQISMDALWYIDPDAGIEGDPWLNSLAAEPPIYNDDYTMMTIKLREGIYWSDGVEFTADDVVFTVETLKAHPTMAWGANFEIYVDQAYKTDDYTVVLKLKQPNSRMHATFTVRWSGCYIMPKHIFEKVENPEAYKFNPPVSLGPYVLESYDPNGYWNLWKKRDDWERSTLGKLYGEPGPNYVLYIGLSQERRFLDQMKHELDIVHDLAPEAAISLIQNNPYSVTWFEEFPWAHPDPTLISLLLNHEKYPYNIPEVRWALTLSLNMPEIALASYNGAATISPIAVPPTGNHLKWYFDPLEEWLKEFYIEVDGQKFFPYDDTIPFQVTDLAQKQFGYEVPDDPEKIKESLGYGWWKYSPETAEKLLISQGFTKDNRGRWRLPNGDLWRINIICEAEGRPIATRGAEKVAEQWRRFGIDAQIQGVGTAILWPNYLNPGNFEVAYAWNIETWGGHPDLSFFLRTWHSDFYRESGEVSAGSNYIRYKSDELDKIIEDLIKSDFFDYEESISIGLDFLKLMVRDMPEIPLMSYNVFTICDGYYWTGYPTSEDPYTNPVPNWANSKYMFPKLQPTGRK
ncbi:peptide ABC transporter [Petrotoga olearia DSM 13574]|uniref:Peptide ABC transporter n=2 Tax=Petrotoga olearia TaxID=156203 RepID=A0A2K1P539_9BACT|nr:peptide ABC transporter [Petrotoga olearia DSM 13574]